TATSQTPITSREYRIVTVVGPCEIARPDIPHWGNHAGNRCPWPARKGTVSKNRPASHVALITFLSLVCCWQRPQFVCPQKNRRQLPGGGFCLKASGLNAPMPSRLS